MGIWVAMGFMATVNFYQNIINTEPAFSIFITIESYASIRFEVTDVVQTSLLYTDAIITFPSTMPKEYLVKAPPRRQAVLAVLPAAPQQILGHWQEKGWTAHQLLLQYLECPSEYLTYAGSQSAR